MAITKEPPSIGEAAQPASRGYANYVLFMLCLTNVLAIADRNVMSLLLQPIKNDLHASDTVMSFLTGAAFVIFYSLFGIPIARWSDRGNRRNILAAGVAVWSVATMFCGAAQNFAHMALARMGVCMGEATGTPTSLSLIADYYRREVRPQMVSIFNLAVPIGGLAVTPLIGIVADHYGWRMAFLVLGAPGVAVALIVWLTVREPQRGAMDAVKSAVTQLSFGDAMKVMWASKPLRLLLLGTAIVGLGAGTLGAWGSAMMMRAFGVTPTQVASISAPLSGLAGLLGTIVGGFLTTWLIKRTSDQRWLLILPIIAAIVCVPAGLLYVFAPTFAWMVLGGIGGSLTIAVRTSPHMALALDLVPANCRGMAAAAMVIANSVVGIACGPLVVGMISDYLTPSLGPVEALRNAFMFAPATLALGCIPFFMMLRYYNKDGLKPEASIIDLPPAAAAKA